MGQDTEKADEKKFVQLRLPPELAADLEKSAKTANRKLPSEIIFRLQGGADTAVDALIYGWADPGRNKVLGEAIGMLTGRLEVAGPMTDDRVQDRAAVLGMLKIAIGDVLDRMGADDAALSADERSFAALKAREFSNELLRPERHPAGIGPRPDLDILKKVASAEPMVVPHRKVG